MNSEQKELFQRLHNGRAVLADTLQNPAVSSIWNSVTDKYRDQAHFVYELIQNADDAFATYAKFELFDDAVVFRHNGTRHFTVTPIEEESNQNIRHGDINAITGVSFSNKKETDMIGKFGVGFKAVFQYTNSPEIYDKYFRFELQDYIVPCELDTDYPDRLPDETVFYLPFDKAGIPKKTAFGQIKQKLQNLTYPTLFLKNLQSINYILPNHSGLYSVTRKQIYRGKDIILNKVDLRRLKDTKETIDHLYMGLRQIDEHFISTCFFSDEEGMLIKKRIPVYCFFPTNEFSRLNFLIHAPFLLTDSREGIQSNNQHNERMISELATLASDTLMVLRELSLRTEKTILGENILDIVPYDKPLFSDRDSSSQISFYPVFQELQNMLLTQKMIPTKNGFVNSSVAYWPGSKALPDVISDEQLAQLLGKREAHWVFVNEASDDVAKNGNPKGDYIKSLIVQRVGDDQIMNGFSEQFIRLQDHKSLCKIYKWLGDSRNRMDKAKRLPVFPNQNGVPTAALDEDGKYQLFFRGRDDTSIQTILPSLLNDTRCMQLAQAMGIREMNRSDQVNSLLAQCESSQYLYPREYYYQEFLHYYTHECPPSKSDEFCNRVSNLKIFKAVNTNGNRFSEYFSGKELYRKNELLTVYFGDSKAVRTRIRFLDETFLRDHSKGFNDVQISRFLRNIGVARLPRIVETRGPLYYFTIRDKTNLGRFPQPTASKTKETIYIDRNLDMLGTVLTQISSSKDIRRSAAVWDILLALVEGDRYDSFLWYKRNLSSVCKYFYRTEKEEIFDSVAMVSLRTVPWIHSSSGRFCTPAEAGISGLGPNYTTASANFAFLTEFLGMEDIGFSQKERDLQDKYEALGLSEKEIQMFQILKNYSADELDQVVQILKKQKHSKSQADSEKSDTGRQEKKDRHRRTVSESIDAVLTQVSSDGLPEYTYEELQNGQDDMEESEYYMGPQIDFEKRSEREKKRSALALSKIQQQDTLTGLLKNLKKYSYGWLETLLKLEMLDSSAKSKYSHEVSLRFMQVSRDGDSARTLLLEQPASEIPPVIEDLSDFPVKLTGDAREHRVIAEAASIKSYILRVKLKAGEKLEGIDFSKGLNAEIDVQSPEFLQESLLASLQRLKEKHNWENDCNLRATLPQNIEFIFGPPGTGKTTCLAQELLDKLMQDKSSAKILFMAPTNKAADVLTLKIMDLHENNKQINNWLWRYGACVEDRIEEEGILKGKDTSLLKSTKAAVVTTVARYTYDKIRYDGALKTLWQVPWDYIIVDEASMVPLVNIINLLYTGKPKLFYIAGDPFQIAPVTTAVQWKDENIYTLVKLKSFTSCKTIPYAYPVHRLMMQYRSVPELGMVYSRFQYEGKLSHKRLSSSRRNLKLDDWINLDTINLIRFPVSQYESIYRAKKFASGSSYQVYAALFTYEFVHALAARIDKLNPGISLSIGIISPYKGQADLINKLVHSKKPAGHIEIQVGTVHSFQGDECDLMFVVFNTPQSLRNSKRTFLENRSVINVAVSRAREYLFLLVPDEQTEGIEYLHAIQELMRICRQTGKCAQFHASEFEELLFGQKDYLEENTFTTSHQSVNVYGLPEKKYEVRMEDTAVDVQIHEYRKHQETERAAATAVQTAPIFHPISGKDIRSDRTEQVLKKPLDPIEKPIKREQPKPVNFSISDDVIYKVGQMVECSSKGRGVIEGRKSEGGVLKLVIRFKAGREAYSEYQAKRLGILPVGEQ